MAEPVEDVHALIADLLPALVPGAQLDAAGETIVVPVGADRARISTAKLVTACLAGPRHEWPRLVDEWMREAMGMVERMPGYSGDEDTLARLRLWIVPRREDRMAEATASLPYGRYFDALLVLDHPDRIERLTAAQVAALGTMDELQQVAINNTVQQELVTFEVRDQPVPPDQTVRVVSKDGSMYVSSGLFAVHKYLSDSAGYGAFVAVPAYDMMLLHEVNNTADLDFISFFFDMTRAMYGKSEHPCLAEVYWWIDGDLHPIGVTSPDDSTTPRVNLPEELRGVVEGLPRG